MPLHNDKLPEGTWWACQKPEESLQPMKTAFDEKCRECMIAFELFTMTTPGVMVRRSGRDVTVDALFDELKKAQ